VGRERWRKVGAGEGGCGGECPEAARKHFKKKKARCRDARQGVFYSLTKIRERVVGAKLIFLVRDSGGNPLCDLANICTGRLPVRKKSFSILNL